MNDDERRQRQLDALLEHHAQFAEENRQANRRLDRLERMVKLIIHAGRRERREWRERYNALVDSQNKLVESQNRINESQDALIDSHLQTEEVVRRNGEDIKRLAATVERNSEDIKRVAATAERNSEDIKRVAATTERNGEDIGDLAKIVRQLTNMRNGNGRSDT